MKILYSCLSKSWGGMEMYTLTAVKQLLKRDIRVELLCIAESRIHIEANNMGVIIHPVNLSGPVNPFTILKLTSILRRGKYDLIHTQASKDLWILVPALKILYRDTPLILTKQVGSFIIKKDYLHKILYKRLNFAFAISRVIKKNLMETTPLTEDKIILMHNGIDTKRFDPSKISPSKVRNEFNINDDEIVMGMIARFSPGKGHEEFVSASKILNKQYTNLKFLIVGEASRGEDEYADKIKKLVEDQGISNIIFTGYRKDTEYVLAAMDIFVFPSHSEAFGIALAEAMSMGKPSVCSNSDGVLDIAVENETSFLFEKKNASDLAEKLSKLIKSPESRKEFSNNARKRAVANFDIDLLTSKTIKVYENIINKKT